MHNFDNKLAGTVIATPEAKLGWTASSSQTMVMMPKSGKIVYGNRSVHVRGDKYFVINRKKQEVQVVKLDNGKYEVIV